MAIQINEWRPDTCTCIIEFQFEDALPQEQRIHTVHRIVTRGKEHETVLTAEVLYQATLDENRRKNGTLEILTTEDSSLEGSKIQWSFTAGRTLEIRFVDVQISNKTKTDVQELCDTEFGLGKVVII